MLKEENFKRYFPIKGYLHYDRRVHFNRVKDYVMNPNEISTHSFLPLIKYIALTERYIGYEHFPLDNRPIGEKERKIMYASHMDSFIYKYYSILLNNVYNYYANEIGVDKCVTAYRDNKKGLSNIDFSAEVINKIVSYKDAFIFLGDFTNFFDEIDHYQLKINLQRVSKRAWLSDDWYNIYRSLTKYGYYRKDCLNKQYGTDKTIKGSGKTSYFETLNEFRNYQKDNKTSYNRLSYGIPQGTALSGVFANIYCLDFDKNMQIIAENHTGIYRRYSDDFILVVPQNDDLNTESIIKKIEILAETYNLDLQKDKTKALVFKNHNIYNYSDNKREHLDYLGFIFDGVHVRARSKSIYKFYRKSSKLISKARRVQEKKGLEKLPYRKKIYNQYTDMGANKKPFGNFITYMKNSQRIFDRKSPNTVNLMLDQINNRKRKIERMLGYRIHTKVRNV